VSTEFEAMTEAQVQALTAREGAVQRGKPLYADRSWTQVHDEMVDCDAQTVGDLPRARIQALRATTEAQTASLKAGRLARPAAADVDQSGGAEAEEHAP
jgi:hypothetical protein